MSAAVEYGDFFRPSRRVRAYLRVRSYDHRPVAGRRGDHVDAGQARVRPAEHVDGADRVGGDQAGSHQSAAPCRSGADENQRGPHRRRRSASGSASPAAHRAVPRPTRPRSGRVCPAARSKDRQVEAAVRVRRSLCHAGPRPARHAASRSRRSRRRRRTRQGGRTRSGDGVRISTASASANALPLSDVIRARTRSPGRLCRTKMTRPSCLATQWPPCAIGPTSSSIVVPTGSAFVAVIDRSRPISGRSRPCPLSADRRLGRSPARAGRRPRSGPGGPGWPARTNAAATARW